MLDFAPQPIVAWVRGNNLDNLFLRRAKPQAKTTSGLFLESRIRTLTANFHVFVMPIMRKYPLVVVSQLAR